MHGILLSRFVAVYSAVCISSTDSVPRCHRIVCILLSYWLVALFMFQLLMVPALCVLYDCRTSPQFMYITLSNMYIHQFSAHFSCQICGWDLKISMFVCLFVLITALTPIQQRFSPKLARKYSYSFSNKIKVCEFALNFKKKYKLGISFNIV